VNVLIVAKDEIMGLVWVAEEEVEAMEILMDFRHSFWRVWE